MACNIKRRSEFILELENGYQTVCGASGGHLSGGERQRISIARALLKDAPIVILDEATSYTDPENEAVIQSALGRLVRGDVYKRQGQGFESPTLHHKSTVILIELRWTFSMPENRLI